MTSVNPKTSQTAAAALSHGHAISRVDLIEGMAKGMAVLESFDTQRQRLNATLAAERAGLTRAAARRHLLTLTHLGYLETDGQYFWLAAKVLRFSGSYLATARLPRAVQPVLNQLAAQAQASFSVAVLDADEVVIIGRSGSESRMAAGQASHSRVLAYGLHLGARLPAHATSTGLVLLAAKPKVEFSRWLKARTEGLARLTAHTVTQTKEFKALIEQVRGDDHALASQTHELGVHALAVPLRDMQGRTVAALNVVGTSPQMQSQVTSLAMLLLLTEAARVLRPVL